MQTAMFVVRHGDSLPESDSEAHTEGDSLAALVESHARLVYRIALAVLRNPRDAEDVVQETFLQVCRSNRWEQVEDARAYVARIAWRLAIRHKKSCEREQELSLDICSRRPSPEETAMSRELESWVHTQIDALPDKLREPLVLAATGDLKLIEIARLLKLPEGTVRRRIHDARAQLRQLLEARKGGEDGRTERV